MKRPSTEIERVWLLCGAALAALFLLRTAGMIFQGAITGFGMYVALYVLFSWFPVVKRILFGMGGLFDLAVSFGMPYLVASVLGITGGTMLIATLTCGLLFTFSIATKRLGGPFKAASSTTSMVIRDSMSSFEAWREDIDGRRNQVDDRGTGRSDRHRGNRQRSQGEEEARDGTGSRRLIEGVDYTVN